LLADALAGLTMVYTASAQFEEALSLAEQLLHLSERLQEAGRLADAHYLAATASFFRGALTAALEHYERAIVDDDPSADHSFASIRGDNIGVAARMYWAWALWVRGYPELALETGQASVALAREAEDPWSIAHSLTWLSVVHNMRREDTPVHRCVEEAISISELQRFPVPLGVARVIQMWARTVKKPEPAVDAALAGIQEVLKSLGETGIRLAIPQMLGGVADICLGAGHTTEAADYIDSSLAVSQATGQFFWDADLFRLKGEVLLLGENRNDKEAESLFRRAMAVAANQEAKSLELRAATSLARLLQGQARTAEARAALQPVYAWFTEGFETKDLKDAKALLQEPS
jgi:tetratricopeptide (TPR) repeat protein